MTDSNSAKSESEISNVFNKYAVYYDIIYSDKDYVGEVSYVNKLLEDFGITHGKILELGSGSGVHGRLFGELGHIVTGVERSEEMVRQAGPAHNFKCIHGDITNVRLDGTFDAALSLFHVVSYLTTNEQIDQMFLTVYTHLNPGGIFIFDVWYSPCVNYLKPQVKIKRIKNDKYEIIRLAEPTIFSDENKVNVNYTIFARRTANSSWESFQEQHAMRHFSTLELSYIAERNGFHIVRVEEFNTGNKPSEYTWGVCYILKKK